MSRRETRNLTKYYFFSIVIPMKLSIKGQVTIPKRLRQLYGLTPHKEVIFEEAPGGVLIRPAGPTRKEKVRKAAVKVRGIADAGLSTDDILGMSRED